MHGVAVVLKIGGVSQKATNLAKDNLE